jgi:hypothetical protein
MLRRSGKAPHPVTAGIRGRALPPAHISELFPLGDERAFGVSDPDGNLLVFYTAPGHGTRPEWR